MDAHDVLRTQAAAARDQGWAGLTDRVEDVLALVDREFECRTDDERQLLMQLLFAAVGEVSYRAGLRIDGREDML